MLILVAKLFRNSFKNFLGILFTFSFPRICARVSRTTIKKENCRKKKSDSVIHSMQFPRETSLEDFLNPPVSIFCSIDAGNLLLPIPRVVLFHVNHGIAFFTWFSRTLTRGFHFSLDFPEQPLIEKKKTKTAYYDLYLIK